MEGIPISHLPERLTSVYTSVVSVKTLYRWKKALGQFYQMWLIRQRHEATNDSLMVEDVTDLYRKGVTFSEECMFFLLHHFNGKLPGKGYVISAMNISLPTKEWW